MTMDLSGVRKSRNAEESAQKFFQTTNLIVSHFKRDTDKVHLYKLSGEKNTLSNLLIASTTLHCYDFLGIHTRGYDVQLETIEAHQNLEQLERKDLFNEISHLVGKALDYEIDLANIALDYERQILDVLINKIDTSNEDFIQRFKDLLEENLVKALNQYPIVFFYDHIGELTGLNASVRDEILASSAELKATSIELEQDLIREHSSDTYIELSTLAQMVKEMQAKFEFSSVKDLKVEMFSIRKMITQILNHQFNLYPLSKRGLKAFQQATEFKAKLYQKFHEANNTTIGYNEFEHDTIEIIITALKEQVKISPHHFVYYLQNVLGLSFNEIYDLLNRYGIQDFGLFCAIQGINQEQFLKDCKMFQITKTDLLHMNKNSNVFSVLEDLLNTLKKGSPKIPQKSLFEILKDRKPEELEIIKDLCKKNELDFDELQKLYQKKMIVSLSFEKKYPVPWLQGYLYLFDLNEIYHNIARFIFYSFFSRVCRQTARILECYVKLKEDKNLILLGLKRILQTEGTDKWVLVKIEELMIERLMARQRELAPIFNADNQAFFVNAFIWARFMDCTVQDGIKIFADDPSPIYEEIGDYPLPKDMVSPVSYILALDMLKRFKEIQEMKSLKFEQRMEAKTAAEDQKKQDIKKSQEINTLNFIEKKITSTIMIVKKGEMNPTALYWSDKDQKLSVDNIKLHSELKDRQICRACGQDTTDSQCKTHPGQSSIATPLDLFSQYYSFALNRITELWPKLKIPSYDDMRTEIKDWTGDVMKTRLRRDPEEKELNSIIEGERVQVANKVAKSIGEYLDKALYKKFKENIKTE